IHDRPVVAGDDHQRVLRQLQTVERGEDFSGGPIKLNNDIPARPQTAFAGKTRMRNARDMNVVGGEIKEEGLLLVALNELNGMTRQYIGHIFVNPARRMSAAHIADPADAVD